MRAALLVLPLSACIPADPPVRSFHELPAVPPRAGPFQTEAEVFDEVVRALEAAGLSDPAVARLEWSEDVALPTTSGSRVAVRRFLSVVPEERARHLGLTARALYGEERPLVGLDADELAEAWVVLWVAAIANEVSHAVAYDVGAAGLDDAWHEERRARDVEMPVLQRLASAGRVPPHWPELYTRLLGALVDAAPDAVRAAVPSDGEAAATLFRAGYPRLTDPEAQAAVLAGRDPGWTPEEALEARAAGLLAARWSLERARQPVPFETLKDAYAPPEISVPALADAAVRAVAEGMGRAVVVRAERDGVWGTLTGDPRTLVVSLRGGDVRAFALAPLATPATRRAEVLALVNGINGTTDEVWFDVTGDEVRVRGAWTPAPGGGVVEGLLNDVVEASDRWLPGLARVAAGEDPQVVYEAVRGAP